MRNRFLLFIILWVSGLQVWAKHVPADSAQMAAFNFLQQLEPANASARSLSSLTLVHQEVSREVNPGSRTKPLTYYYVFSLNEENGLVFVSADDKVTPILGYTLKGSYKTDRMPPHFLKWLEVYKSEIRYAIQELPEDAESVQKWKDLLEGKSVKEGSSIARRAVSFPLMSTTWDQAPYFNEYCPYDNEARENTVTGCVATAMAQIMKYWEYPAKGSGFHSFNHEKYGTLSANFSSTTYNWKQMPNSLTGPNAAVATLMQHIGVSVDMGYDVADNGGSGAYVISAQSPVEHCSEYALKTYFGYKGVQGVERKNYTLTNWINLLKTELNAGRPVLYAGFGGGGGHAFVCDGYDNNSNFHMNWGWGGYYDGYYAISALNPGGVGTGGGTGGYNSGQQAVIGIQAPESSPGQEVTDMQLYDHITSSASTIYYGEAFSIQTDIINNGSSTFFGDFAAAAFDESGNFVDWIQTYTGNELDAGFYFDDVLFSTEGMLTLLPGNYSIGVFYKTGNGQWEQLKGGSLTDYVTLTVVNDNLIDLSSALAVNNVNQLYQGKTVKVKAALKNKGNTAFRGWVDVSLYQLDGTHAYTIEEKENVEICAGCTSGELSFQNSNLDVAPGTYLMAVLHYPENGEAWELSGSSQFTNPIQVVVQVAPLAGDPYEDNNDVQKAYRLPLSFTSNTASITTTGSSIHVGTDYDYYKLILPEGNMYELTIRVHDSYNSGNNQVYTNDVLFSLSDDGVNWSDAFDDVLSSAVEVEGGTTVYFLVSPYFQGETGTYLLDVKVRQTQPTGIGKDLPVSQTYSAYPNPTNGVLHLNVQERFEYAELANLNGQILQKVPANTQQMDLSGFPNGLYLLRIRSKEGYQVQKIIKE